MLMATLGYCFHLSWLQPPQIECQYSSGRSSSGWGWLDMIPTQWMKTNGWFLVWDQRMGMAGGIWLLGLELRWLHVSRHKCWRLFRASGFRGGIEVSPDSDCIGCSSEIWLLTHGPCCPLLVCCYFWRLCWCTRLFFHQCSGTPLR